MRSISVVTTFNQKGLEDYAQNMINTFVKTWPSNVTLYLYAEDCTPVIPKDANNVKLLDLHAESTSLVNFKNKWKNIPKANGDVTKDPIRSKRRDAGKGFKWDAVRFSHKVYSIFECAKICNTDILMWMDADMICHSQIHEKTLQHLLPEGFDLWYVGRERKWPECGLYAINLKTANGLKFLQEFERVWDDAENGIFQMDEWHDSFVFEEVRKKMPIKSHNWGEGIVRGEGHPLINSVWGGFLDHLKGGRKTLGKSRKTDLLKPRAEQYWRNI